MIHFFQKVQHKQADYLEIKKILIIIMMTMDYQMDHYYQQIVMEKEMANGLLHKNMVHVVKCAEEV